MKRNHTAVAARAIEVISPEQYQAILSELLRIREEVQNLKSTRGLDHTSVPVVVDEPVVVTTDEPEPVAEPIPEPVAAPAEPVEPAAVVTTEEPVAVPSLPLPAFASMTGPSGPTVPLDKYMELFAKYVSTQDENLKLRSKNITLQENIKLLGQRKTSKRQKLEGEALKNAIIEIILNSGMNIDAIPDEVEREIYSFLITQISVSTSFLKRFFMCG